MDEHTSTPANPQNWSCPVCHNSNSGKFCTHCGTARPDAAITAADQPLDLLRQRAAAGDSSALYELAQRIINQQAVPLPNENVDDLYRRAAALGNDKALLLLGDACFDNSETEQALDYYEKAADKGNTEAMFNLADYYESLGYKEPRYYVTATDWYQKAAQAGNADAMDGLATNYELGWGVAENHQEAFRWYSKAAELGNADSMNSLGDYYSFDIDDESRDYSAEAVSWYLKAAAAGNDEAMISLAERYENGDGVPLDKHKALMWRKKADDILEVDYRSDEDIQRLEHELASAASHTVGMPNTVDTATTPSQQKPLIIAVIVLLVIVAGFVFDKVSVSHDQAANTSSAVTEKQSSKKAQSDTPSQNVEKATSEMSLGDVSIGDSLKQVHGTLGIEKRIEKRENGLVAYKYRDLNVIMKDGFVRALESNTNYANTKRDIHQGSSLNDVLSAYGNDVMKTEYNGLILYEYDKKKNSNVTCRLRFAIDQSNTVNYITIRVLE